MPVSVGQAKGGEILGCPQDVETVVFPGEGIAILLDDRIQPPELQAVSNCHPLSSQAVWREAHGEFEGMRMPWASNLSLGLLILVDEWPPDTLLNRQGVVHHIIMLH